MVVSFVYALRPAVIKIKCPGTSWFTELLTEASLGWCYHDTLWDKWINVCLWGYLCQIQFAKCVLFHQHCLKLLWHACQGREIFFHFIPGQKLSIHQVVALTLHPRCNISLYFFSSFLVTPALSFQKEPISYSLLINPSSLFSIDQESGEISLTRSLDYETDQHRYLLLVRASENKESLSSAAEVRLSRTKASISL